MAGVSGEQPQAAEGAYSDDDEVFIDGKEASGFHVVADITGNQDAPADDSGSDGEGEGGAEGEGGDAAMEVEDDSLHTFEGHSETVFAVAWNPTVPNLVATGGADDISFMWRAGATDGATCELRGHTDTVASAGFSSDGSLLATSGLDGQVMVWDSANGERLRILEGSGEAIEWVRWHPRGNVLLAGSEDFTTWMWNAQTGACMQVLSGHSGPVTCGAFTPDGKFIVTGGGDGDASLKAWNPRTGECTCTIQGYPYHTKALTALDVHSDATTVITGSEDFTAQICNIQSSRVVGSLTGHTDSVEAVAFSSIQPVAATASMDGRLLVWDNSTLGIRSTCQHGEGVVALACHPTAPLIYTGCLDGVLRLWDLRTGQSVRRWTGHGAGIQTLALNPDGNMIITGSDDHTARIFSAA